MLVYGDLERSEDAATLGHEVEQRLHQCLALPAGLERHEQLVAAFIRAGELVQGVLDAEFHCLGHDDLGPSEEAASRLLRSLADAIATSWDSRFTLCICADWGADLAQLAASGTLTTRQAEGYAFYALYPEAYLAAARESGLGPQTAVIGLRSIGTGLGAVVASGLRSTDLCTVRPIGHPFDRRLALSPRLERHLANHAGDFAIVDEGPGLSGSSFNCVADWLVAHGVAASRIHFFPSHHGDLGAAARADHRQRWSSARKHVGGFDRLLLERAPPAHRLQHWISAIVGPTTGKLVDLSGGAWRPLQAAPAPVAADPAMERRKYLLVTEQGRWLAKFAGLGPAGEARLALARTLSPAGFTPPPAGLCHGFLVTPWLHDESTPGATIPTDRLADYLAFRASLPAERPGAGPQQLAAMAAYNIAQVLGEAAGAAVQAWLGDAASLEGVPCCTDNRMHRWEWICSGGTWLKLDALDHHAAHDLVGCQDISWDIAGAAVELDLSTSGRDLLAAMVSHRIGRHLPMPAIEAHELCYLGFQLGLWTMASQRAGTDQQEQIQRQLRRYLAHPALRRLPGRH